MPVDIFEKYMESTAYIDCHDAIRNLILCVSNSGRSEKPLIIACQPPKTGDHTIMKSIGSRGNYVNLIHRYLPIFNELKSLTNEKRIKVISAVREPIAQNISLFFEINFYFVNQRKSWEGGGDVQALYDDWIDSHMSGNRDAADARTYANYLLHYGFIQYFFENQLNKLVGTDVYAYPFDKQKGYSVIKNGNMEIFIYQLEKLNGLTDELGDFLDIEDFKLQNDNVASEKWYYGAYRQAMDELKFSRKYFDYSYESKYVNHFYSAEDIARFKEKWSGHIVD